MADFPANGQWTIYSVQKTLPFLGWIGAIFGTHNYLALVKPDGEIDSEMQGVYTGGFVMNGSAPGNYLNVRMYDRGRYIPDQSILSAKPVFLGSEEELRDLLHVGYRETVEALDEKHMLYNGAAILGHAVNSNSVWYTALLVMGVEDPSKFDGWGSTPGNRIDLRKEPTNNSWFGTSRDPWVPNPAFFSRFPGAFYLPPTAEHPLDDVEPAQPAIGDLEPALEEEQGLLRHRLQEIEALLASIDEDALPVDQGQINDFLSALNGQLDSLGALTGADLLDRLRDLVDRLNEWRDYLQDQIVAPADPDRPADDDWGNEEETEAWEEPSPQSYQEHEPEFEPAYEGDPDESPSY